MTSRKVKLDLHGVKHKDVKDLVIGTVEDHWDADVELEIVTGHSDTMKTIVTDVLNEYQLPYTNGSLFNKGIVLTYI